MKSLIRILFIFYVFSAKVYAQCPEYIIISISGGEIYLENMKLLKGSKLKEANLKSIKYKNPNTKIRCKDLCSGGEYLLTSTKIQGKGKSTFGENFIYLVGVDTKTVPTATKGDDELHRLQYILTASENPKRPNNIRVVGNELMIPLASNDYFKLNEKEYFIIEYNYNGKIINKKLQHEENKLIFDSNHIFRVSGNSINQDKVSDMKLIYISEIKDVETFICSLRLFFESDI